MNQCGEPTARGERCKRRVNDGPCKAHRGPAGRRAERRLVLMEDGGGDTQAPPSLLARPMILPEEAGRLWDALVEKLTAAKVLDELDGPALLNLVMAYHFALQAGSLLVTDGMVQPEPQHRGRTRKHPAFQMWRDSQAAFRRWTDTFKMTPASRKGLLTAKDELSDLEKLLRRRP